MDSKVCRKCGETKPLSDFEKQKGAKDGHRHQCKKCRNVVRNRRIAADPEKRRKKAERTKEYMQSDEAKQLARERNRRYRETHRKEISEAGKRYWKENYEACLERQRKYHAKNPGLSAAWTSKYRANRKKATPKWADLKEIERIFSEGSEKGLHVDHVYPLKSKWVCGLHVEANLQLLTASENLTKSNGNTYIPRDEIWQD